MGIQTPLSKTNPAFPKLKDKQGAKSFHSVVGRTPNTQTTGNIAASAWKHSPEHQDSGTVIAAGKFKATCLELLDRAALGETITITKHGKVVGRLVPPVSERPKEFRSLSGRMRGRGKILGDIVSPDFEAWGMVDPRKRAK